MRGKTFLDSLEKLKHLKAWTAARAALRRGLAFPLGTYAPAVRHLEPLLPASLDPASWAREAHYLVAGLYALKDGDHWEGRSLTDALRDAGQNRGSESIEMRFLALLDADRDQLAYRLRQAVGLVEGGLDFARLLDDQLAWFRDDRRVQARWAQEFYRPSKAGQVEEDKR